MNIGRRKDGPMFKKILIVIILSVVTSAAYGQTYPENTKRPQPFGGAAFYYGKDGTYLGSSQKLNGITIFKNERGQFTGKSLTTGSSTFYYDTTGSYLGKSQESNGLTTYFNQRGGFMGSSRP